MDRVRLSRILTDKISRSSHLPYWQLKMIVDQAITDSLKTVSEVEELIDLMHTGVVRFCYTKKEDGSTREAIGTLKQSILDGFRVAQKKLKGNTIDCVVYFDLERENWRCFCPENFISRL